MAAEWTWELCDGQGASLAELVTATGRQLTFRRNSYAEATCTISCDDVTAALLSTALKTGWPQLRCWRRADRATSATLVFNGSLAPIIETSEGSATLQIVARSPLWRLSLRSFLQATEVQAGTQLDGTTITNMLAYADFWQGPSGLAIGNIDTGLPSHGVSLSAGASVGGAIQKLTEMLDGVDVVERFVSPTVTLLDVMSSAGSVRPNTRFEYGPDTAANLRSALKITAPPVNYCALLGSDGLISIQQDTASQAAYGTWPVQLAAPATGFQDVIDSLARAQLRPFPVTTIQIVPETTAPRPWDDYYLGDTVQVYANRGSLQINTAARVNAFTVVIDDNGLEQAEIPDPRTEEDQMALNAQLALEVTGP